MPGLPCPRLPTLRICAVAFVVTLLLGCTSSHLEPHAVVLPHLTDLDVATVKMPTGFTHTFDQGIDTKVGHFTSPDGKLIIHYDIGHLAGVYARQTSGKEILLSTNYVVHDLVALVVISKEANLRHLVISLPEGGPANFYANIRNDIDTQSVLDLVFTYELKSNH